MKEIPTISIGSSPASASIDHEQLTAFLKTEYASAKRTKAELTSHDAGGCISSHLYGQMCAYRRVAQQIGVELMA